MIIRFSHKKIKILTIIVSLISFLKNKILKIRTRDFTRVSDFRDEFTFGKRNIDIFLILFFVFFFTIENETRSTIKSL